MEEFDSHTEHASEQAHEAAHESKERWITGVALTAAILAALAAISSMIAGHHEHESMMLQMKASDRWSQYQAKKIKTLLRQEQIDNLSNNGGDLDPATQKKLSRLKKQVEEADAKEQEIRKDSQGLEAVSGFHDHLHIYFARSVTLFQVAIAVSAIAALTRRRAYWLVGIALGVVALGTLSAGLLVGSGVVGHRPPDPEESATQEAADTRLDQGRIQRSLLSIEYGERS